MANAFSVPVSRRASESGSASGTAGIDAESASQLLAHVKLLLRRGAAMLAVLDAGLAAETVRHFSKVLDARTRSRPLAYGRAEAFRSTGEQPTALSGLTRRSFRRCGRVCAPTAFHLGQIGITRGILDRHVFPFSSLDWK
ncbi:hypothetical protein E2562_016584 [Oryza meyeriana var. granulata]|uniref:Uncharacterized protein n=1 Tax=Oryza meyeriana var. granulata TaxID=110450 RepID=A0A6G1C6T7_9ORYZ|nr:hypothetical protein E2562_016584 [Oryza meyeriana var. granulata]